MQVHDVHSRGLFKTTTLSSSDVERMVDPYELIGTLNAAKVRFLLVGAHGLTG